MHCLGQGCTAHLHWRGDAQHAHNTHTVQAAEPSAGVAGGFELDQDSCFVVCRRLYISLCVCRCRLCKAVGSGWSCA